MALDPVVGAVTTPFAFQVMLRSAGLFQFNRIGWSISGSSGSYLARLVKIVSVTGETPFAPLKRRHEAPVSDGEGYRGVLTVGKPAGETVWTSWTAASLGGGGFANYQEGHIENPIELPGTIDDPAGPIQEGWALEFLTLVTGNGMVACHADFNEFRI